MYFRENKEVMSMTNVIRNMQNIIVTDEKKWYFDGKISNLKNKMLIYVYMKLLVNSDYSRKLIKTHIVRNKNVNSGSWTIKGTRVTPGSIACVISMTEGVEMGDILRELPTLNNEEQVLAGIFCYLKEECKLRRIILEK